MKRPATFITNTTRQALAATVAFALSTSVFANPVLDHVSAGQVTIQQAPNNTIINQSSQKAIINWQSFNIGAQESTHFQQPQGGIALNRINPSQGVSQIYGRLTASGQIILVNPAGIYFGPGSYVNVGGLIATTMNITDQDFLNSYYRFANTSGYNGAVVNKGTLIAADNGLVALIGGAVSNEGFIQANMGNVILASGETATMTFAGNDLVSFSVDSGVTQRAKDLNGDELSDGVKNTGGIYANGGRIMITAKDAAGVLDRVINMEGVAQTMSVSDGAKPNDGEIILLGEGDHSVIRLAGLIDASGKAVDQFGGNISVTGYNILLDSTAVLDASGSTGGGKINIGGNYLGKGPLPNANAVVMNAGASLLADALTHGNGGEVIVWSDVYTNVNGNISARGGNESGHGGFIETSGKKTLLVGNINIDTSAPHGNIGTWLLDPTNIYIAASQANATTAGMSGTDSSANTGAGVNPVTFGASAAIQDSYLSTTALTTALASANVIVTTNNDAGVGVGDITVVDPISWNSAFNLTLSAYHSINVNGTTSITNAGSGSIFLKADNTGTGSGGVTFGTGYAQVGVGGSVLIFYSPVTFGAPTALENTPYTGGTTPVSYQLITGLGTDSDVSTERTLGSVSINSALWGQNFALAKNIDASATTSWNSGAGFDPIGNGTTTYFTGKFHGQDFAISNLYFNRPTESNLGLFSSLSGASIKNTKLINPSYYGLYSVGGFAGSASSTELSYLQVIGGDISGVTVCSGSCGGNFGGIAGHILFSTIDHAYNSANITAKIYIGGISGYTGWTTISDSYNTGTIHSLSPFNKYTGGISGLLYNNTVVLNNVYNSGYVYGIANSYTSIGAFTGWNNGATITNSFWDIDTTGQTSPVGSGSTGTVAAYAGCPTGNCTTSTASVSPSYLFGGTAFADLSAEATYTTTLTTNGGTAWDITSTPSTTATAPTSAWFIFDGGTRPILTSELSSSITNPHELQLMGIALGGNYTLVNDIDFSAVTASDIWGTNISAVNFSDPFNFPATTGFAPIGESSNPFTGSFDGQNHTINNVLVSFPAGSTTDIYSTFPLYVFDSMGLFGETSAAASIQNVAITNSSVIGRNYVGGIVGYNRGTIDNVSYSGQVYGRTYAGGIAGYNTNAISNSHNTAYVVSKGTVGGIAGYSTGTIMNTYNTGRVQMNIYGNNAGGLVGVSTGSVINSFNTGAVAGSGALYDGYFGGLVGDNYGLIDSSYNLGSTGGQYQNQFIGGIAGRNRAAGNITNSYNYGFLFEQNQMNSPTMGGIAGQNDGAIANVFSIGSGYGRNVQAGGVVGTNTGTVVNAFWDTAATNASSSFGFNINSGTFNATNGSHGTFDGSDGANLSQQTTFCPSGTCSGDLNHFDFASIWGINEGQSYPYLRAFYSTAPRAIVAITPATTISSARTAVLVVNGTVFDSLSSTGANGLAYFLEGNNLISNTNNTIADNVPLLLYTTGILSNAVELTPVSGGGNPTGSIHIESGTIFTNSVTVGYTGNSTLGSADLSQAIGALGATNSNIFYTVSGNNVTLKSGRSITSTSTTNYVLDGNLTATSANITLNGPVSVNTASAVVTTNTSGNINISNTVDGNNNDLTINTAGTTSSVTGVMSNLNNLTKSGSGTLTLSEINTYTGATSINGGTLSISADNNLGAAPGTATVGHLTFNGGTLQNTSAMTINANRGITLGASGGRLDTAADLTYNGSIAGTGVLTKLGAGMLTLDSAQTYSGGTLLSAGTLSLGNNTAIGTGTLTFNGGSFAVNTADLVIANNIVLNVAANFSSALDFTLNGLLSGAGGVTQAGTNIVTLGNTASTYTGKTTITSGTLSITNLANLSANSSLGRPTTTANGTIDIGATGVLYYNGTGSSSNRIINATADGATINASGSGALTLTGGITGANNDLVLTGTGNALVSGNITNTDGTVTVSGSGVWTFGGTNTYGIGASTIIDGATLSIASDAALGCVPDGGGCAPIPDPDNIQLLNGGTLQTTASFEIDAGRGITLGTGGGIIDIAFGTLTYNGVIAGANSLSFTGTGALVTDTNITAPSSLSFASGLGLTFGGTEISSSNGNLSLNSTTTLTSNSNVKLDANGAGSDLTVGSLTWTGTNTVALESADQMNLNGAISGVNGTLTLTAANTSQSIETDYTNGSIDVGNFHLITGQWYQLNATLPEFTVRNSFTLSNDVAAPSGTSRFLRALGGNGTSGNPYQLTDIYGIQGINSGAVNDMVHSSFILANDIDASGTRYWNNGLGFHPIGYFYSGGAGWAFNGHFNGNNKVIDGLFINRSQTDGASFGEMGAALFAVTWAPQIYNLGLTNVNITSQNNRAAGLVAFASWQSWWTSPRASFSNIYVTGEVTTRGNSMTGGIIGYLGDGTISNSYNAATVTAYAGGVAGGVVGWMSDGGITTIASNVYNIGKVQALGTGGAGGITYNLDNADTYIINSYNSGSISGGNTSRTGAIVGFNGGSTAPLNSNNFWDTETSNVTVGAGSAGVGGTTGIAGRTSAQMMQSATFTGWSIASTGFTGSTPPAGTWLILNGQTRPMLRSEWNTTIRTPHQLQLMSTALSANYLLAGDVDLTTSMTNRSDVWNTNYNLSVGAGFVPVGAASAAFTGSFNGANNTINNLYMNAVNKDTGLFGYVNSSGSFSNIHLTNLNLTLTATNSGPYRFGGLIGMSANAISVTGVSTSGNITGLGVTNSIYAGGLIGILNSGSITGSYSTSNVIGTADAGGLVAQNLGLISLSYFGGSVSTTGNGLSVGGIAGWNPGTINDSYNVGSVTGYYTGLNIGGISGNNFGSINRSYNSGLVTAPAGTLNIGGVTGTYAWGGTVNNSFWDVDSSGQIYSYGVFGNASSGSMNNVIGGCFTGSCTNAGGTATLSSRTPFGNSSWSISNGTVGGVFTNATPPATTWIIFEGGTRPMLRMEWNTTIRNPHQVQLMGAALDADYSLRNDVDMTSAFNNTSEVWATNRGVTGEGFMPIAPSVFAPFTGSLDGNNYVINNLYINSTKDINVGFFANLGNGSISNIGLTNADVTSTITTSATNQHETGGLVAASWGSISNAFVSGSVTHTYYSLYSEVGGLVGMNFVFGPYAGSITNSYNLANVTVYPVFNNAQIKVGGLVGISVNNGTTISNSYNAGSVNVTYANSPAILAVGGLVGQNGDNASVITNSYNVGTVTALGTPPNTTSFAVGGLVGLNANAGSTITHSYNSGVVNASPEYYKGGLVGVNGGTISNSFWDVDTSGQVAAAGSGTTTNVYAGCFTGTCTTLPGSVNSSNLFSGTTFANLSALASYTTTLETNGGTAWSITSTPNASTIAPQSTWFVFEGSTRPLLMMEQTTNVRNAHQLQLMAAVTGAEYTLMNDIDFNTIGNTDVWGVNFSSINVSNPYGIPSSPPGFVPIGTNSAAFNGSFDGNNHTINRLYSNRASSSYIGLFGRTGNSTTIKDLTMTLPVIIGSSNVGAIAGYSAGVIDNVSVIGNTGSFVWVGGALQFNNIDIRGSTAGGIAGTNAGIISNSHAAAQQFGGNVGGIAGTNNGVIIHSYGTGGIQDGGNSTAGGLVGTNSSTGVLSRSFYDGRIELGYYSSYYGGLVARNYGLITESYNNANILTGFWNAHIGGLVGRNESTGVITNSYNRGNIHYAQGQATNTIAGFAGTNAGQITNSLNYGSNYYHFDPASTNYTGFVGQNTGTITNSFWDIGNSSYARGYSSNSGTINGLYAGCFGNAICNGATAITNATNAGGTAVDLTKLATYTTGGPAWDMTNIWGMIEDQSYPYLRSFYPDAPRIISGYHPGSSGSLGMSIAFNGQIRDSETSYSNGFVYFLEGNNQISGIDNSFNDGDGVLIFTTSGARGNFATYAPSAGASISGPNGFQMTTNTVTAGNTELISGLITPLTNAQVAATIGGLSNSNILFTGSGNNLTVTNGYSFATTAITPYSIDGNITVTNANMTFNGTVALNIPNVTLTSTGTGNIIINNTVNGNNNAFTINNAGSAGLVSGAMSNLSSFTKGGTGTLVLTAGNTYTGNTTISAGTLQLGNGGSTGSILSPSVTNNGILIFNRSDDFTYGSAISGTGAVTKQNANTIILTGNNTYSGTTTISAGTLQIGNGSTAGSIGTGNISNIGGLVFSRSDDLTISNNISGTGTLSQSGAGTVILAGSNTYSGLTTINTGNLQIGNGGLNGSISGAIVNNSALIFNLSNDFTLSNAISGAGSIEKAGTNTMTIGGLNTYTGSMLISNGTLIVASPTALGGTTAGTTIGSNGTLQISDTFIGGELLTINGGTLSSTGTSALVGNIVLGANSTINVQLNTLTFSGIVDDGANTYKLIKTGPGELRLPGAHTLKGGIDLDAGVLAIGANNSLGNGTFTFNGGSLSVTTADLNITRNIVLNADLNLTGTNNFTLAGDITNGGATARTITKTGTGTVTLSGNNLFSGGLNITQGMLIANSDNALGTGMTTVSDGTTLQIADGRTVSGDITLNGTGMTGTSGSLVGVGTAAITGNVTLNADVMIGTNSVSDTFTLGGNINGSNALILTGPGTMAVNADIGNTTAPTSLTANTNLMVAADITTSGDQTYNNAVTLTGNAMFEVSGNSTQNISFNGDVSGGQDLTIMGSGTGTYNFAFNGGITQNNVTVDGGAGSADNRLTVDSGSNQTFMITGSNGGSLTGIATIPGNFNFSNIHNLTGGANDDNFILSGGTLAGTLNGAGGTNSLTGANVANTWNITSNNGGTVTGLDGLFSNMQNLTGGTGLDTFNMFDGFTISGMINGGDLVNRNAIRFDDSSFDGKILNLRLGAPVGSVIDSGSVFDAANMMIASFAQVQQGNGNGLGYITLPTELLNAPSLSVTFYDATLLNGEIADPFYFYGWSVGNLPSMPPATSATPPVAQIVNQPEVNKQNNSRYTETYGGYGSGDPSVLNKTFVEPLLDTTTVQAGSACYRVAN